jgi:hypothetical protein
MAKSGRELANSSSGDARAAEHYAQLESDLNAGAAALRRVDALECELRVNQAARNDRMKRIGAAAGLPELIAESGRRRGSIILAHGDVAAEDVLNLAAEMADRIESEVGDACN